MCRLVLNTFMMKYTNYCFLLLLLVAGLGSRPAFAQNTPTVPEKSSKKAFGMSLLLPGLGHRYVHDGSWRGAASVFALADVGIWLGVLGSEWHRDHLVDNYTTLAASQAHAVVEGKDRTFFLNLAAYHSSDEYVDVMLRERAWDQIDYVRDRSYQWEWETEEDFQRFRALREDAESLRRRRPVLIAMLVGNRLLAGITSVRAANRNERRGNPPATLSLQPPPTGSRTPLVHLSVHF